MKTIKINILNPKVHNILKNLEDLGLISITDSEDVNWKDVLSSIRDKSDNPPDMDEIGKEVEVVRSKRHDKKK